MPLPVVTEQGPSDAEQVSAGEPVSEAVRSVGLQKLLLRGLLALLLVRCFSHSNKSRGRNPEAEVHLSPEMTIMSAFLEDLEAT